MANAVRQHQQPIELCRSIRVFSGSSLNRLSGSPTMLYSANANARSNTLSNIAAFSRPVFWL